VTFAAKVQYSRERLWSVCVVNSITLAEVFLLYILPARQEKLYKTFLRTTQKLWICFCFYDAIRWQLLSWKKLYATLIFPSLRCTEYTLGNRADKKKHQSDYRCNRSRLIKKEDGDGKAAKIKDRFMYAAYPSILVCFFARSSRGLVYTLLWKSCDPQALCPYKWRAKYS
jgi:hypothetical protein